MSAGVSQPTTDKYAEACVRIAEEVAAALTAVLGEEWAEWGEGGLADGVRMLAQQRDEAERRGAVKALREEAARGERAAACFVHDDAERQHLGRKLLNRTVKAIAAQADRIESGDVAL